MARYARRIMQSNRVNINDNNNIDIFNTSVLKSNGMLMIALSYSRPTAVSGHYSLSNPNVQCAVSCGYGDLL